MSRIHDVLSKAEREGTAQRMRSSESAPTALRDGAERPPIPPAHEPRIRVSPIARHGVPHAPGPADLSAIREIEGVQLDPVLVAGLAPQAAAAEEYRALRTRIAQAENGRTIQTIAITSPGKGDGKSVNAANLALTMAQEFQRRVLLMDADLRRPRAHELLGLTEGAGLADVLMGAVDLNEAIVSLKEHRLAVLPAGIPPSHPAELLSSSAMRRLMDTLRQRFDRIVIDLPPVAPLADVHILAPLLDGVVLIVRAGVTPKPAIERALSGFDRAKVLGLVLNEAGTGTGSGYQEYGYLRA